MKLVQPCGDAAAADRPLTEEGLVPAILDKILRAGEGKILRKLSASPTRSTCSRPDFESLTDAELRALTDQYRERVAAGESLDDLLPEAFATVREAARRTLGQRHYDVQIMGGAALHLGNIAEMRTGEGKTLVSTLPAYLNALSRRRRARRHRQRLPGRARRGLDGPGAPLPRPQRRRDPRDDEDRKTVGRRTQRDITYGTNNEFGFDYLRDNMAWSSEELVQRGHNFAVVDEVDSILVDEARTPLIISGPADQPQKWYTEFAKLMPRLKRDEDYEVDEKKRTVGILEPGVAKVEDFLGIDNLYESVNTPLVGFLNNALKAQGALQARQGLRRHERRGAHRRRAHRPHPRRPSLQRGHAPGDRGEGGRRDQAGEPDARDDHAAELLPALRQALRHDRYGHDRGRRVPADLQARCRADPDRTAR